jgi:uncharacterized protein YgbK (DUF1537 family)
MIRLGCIADDFTGATDLANNLVRAGMRTVQTFGVPDDGPNDRSNDGSNDRSNGGPGEGSHNGSAGSQAQYDADAIVVALKSRTTPPADAIAESLRALEWLRAQGATQIYFKYCSTFDSTAQGNIGPVAEALMDALGTDFTIATPAFPDNQRTVFKGYLFVGDVLLNESGMRDHPLTPMTDANLVRVLQAQSRRQVGLVDYRAVGQGASAIRERMDALRQGGIGMAIVDAVSNDDLLRLGEAVKDMPLITGGSGLAIGLPANFGLRPSPAAEALPAPQGSRAIVSGSCSQATLRQVRHFIDAGGAALAIDPLRFTQGKTPTRDEANHKEHDKAKAEVHNDTQDRAHDAARDLARDEAQRALEWARPLLAHGPVLVYSTAAPDAVRRAQETLGVDRAGALVEDTLAQVARGLVDAGVRQMIVAGGETSGACVQAMGLTQLRIGTQIDPGVPWCHGRGGDASVPPLHVALKSGNFGADDFFVRAFSLLD